MGCGILKGIGRVGSWVGSQICRHAGLGEIKDINNRPSHAIPRT